MTKMQTRYTLPFVGLGILLLMGISLVVFLNLPDPCSNEVVSEVPSPNGELKAVIFTRNCGATTANSRQITILPASHSLPNEAGNVFISDREPPLTVQWTDDQNLIIEGGGPNSPFPVPGFPSVRVTYR